jgi:hypothetical protein
MTIVGGLFRDELERVPLMPVVYGRHDDERGEETATIDVGHGGKIER